MLRSCKVPYTGATALPSCKSKLILQNTPLSDNSVEYLKYYTVTGVLSPNNQYNIY